MLLLILACTRPVAEAAVSDFTWAPTASEQAPMGLTAADGTGLRLAAMHVEAVVEEPLAYTELHLVFENPEDRQLEGRFEITLPEGAAISRFAMKLGDLWQEGEVVELQAARRAYEDFLHRRTDPALLEYDAGNEFRARVFPIEPRGKKELIISWSHDLDVGEPWTLPTGGLPELGLLTASVAQGGRIATLETEYFVPEGDLALRTPGTPALALRGENTSVIRLQPELSVAADPLQDVTVLVDTSASRALSWEPLLADLKAVLGGCRGQLTVLAYDQQVTKLYEGPAKKLGSDVLASLRTREALGASDLEAALQRAGKGRVVVLTDGVNTAGEKPEIQAERLDVVIRGGARDVAAAQQWTEAGQRPGVVLDADAIGAEEVVRRLGLGTAGTVEISVPGADWVSPGQVTGLQPGDTLTVYADLPRSQKLALLLDGESVGKLEERRSDGPLLVRASAQAEIEAMRRRERTAKTAEEREQIAATIVEISTKNRVLSPHTALLVLETEQDYERFGIPRNALADILVVEDGALTWLERGTPVFGDSEGVDAPVNEDRVSDEEEEKPDAKKKEASMEMDANSAAPPPPPSAAPREEAERHRREAEASVARVEEERRARPRRDEAARRAAEEARAQMELASGDVANPFDEDEAPSPEPVEEEPAASTNPLDAWEGEYREVMVLVLDGKLAEAETKALAWRRRSPGDPLALLALGEVWQQQGKLEQAARAYGSLIDLFPSRADLRRLAGERLEALGDGGLALATDTYRRAVEQRPDHPSGHRNLAWTLAKAGEHQVAIEVIEAALKQPFDRFAEAHRILREDAGLIAAAWKRADKQADVDGAIDGMQVKIPDTPGLRFVLNWETDANDVDFHIYDGKKGHAYYSDKQLKSGGELYADITTGYGPECFAIDKPKAFPYRMQAHYYSRGPMGFGMGKLQVIEHDGQGRLHFDERPFVVMTDGAYVPLGEVEKSAF